MTTTGDGPTFRHIVLFRWREGATEGDVQRVADGLADLAASVPSVRSMTFGPDAGVSQGTADFGVVVEFDSAEDYLAYAHDEAHLRLIADAITPILAERTAVQYVVRHA